MSKRNSVATVPTADSLPDVLTLAEASAYLRIPEKELGELAERNLLPARKIGKEWRVLKGALQDWLRPPECKVANSKEGFLQMFGKWKNDPTLGEMMREIFTARGRSKKDVDALVNELNQLQAENEP